MVDIVWFAYYIKNDAQTDANLQGNVELLHQYNADRKQECGPGHGNGEESKSKPINSYFSLEWRYVTLINVFNISFQVPLIGQ